MAHSNNRAQSRPHVTCDTVTSLWETQNKDTVTEIFYSCNWHFAFIMDLGWQFLTVAKWSVELVIDQKNVWWRCEENNNHLKSPRVLMRSLYRTDDESRSALETLLLSRTLVLVVVMMALLRGKLTASGVSGLMMQSRCHGTVFPVCVVQTVTGHSPS